MMDNANNLQDESRGSMNVNLTPDLEQFVQNARAAGDPDIAWHVGCTASSRLTSSRLTAPQTTSPRATKDED